MTWFGQGKDTIEWNENRPDLLFYKWPNSEIKKGAKLIIRSGQKAIFFAGGKVEGVFEEAGTFDIVTQIVPFLSTLSGWFSLRRDSGMRAEVYFVNAKELLLQWGTPQRVMIPSPEVPTGIPVGCNGNLIVEFRDYLKFITKIAGVKSIYSLDDIKQRIMGELSGIVAEAILSGQQSIGINALIQLQANNRKLSKKICEELDMELFELGLGVRDVNILSINYPRELQAMAEKVASQSFVQDVGKYTAMAVADSIENGTGGNNLAGLGAQIAMGHGMAQQMNQYINPSSNSNVQSSSKTYICTGCGKVYTSPAKFCSDCGKPIVESSQQAQTESAGSMFCPKCRKMTNGKFCPDCGTQTV